MQPKPKTDLDRTKEFLRSLGIEFYDDNMSLILTEGMDKVGGYPKFETIFTFDKKGNFIEVGAYK